MFGFLKDKLKSAVKRFSDEVDEVSDEIVEEKEIITQETEEPVQEELGDTSKISEIKGEKVSTLQPDGEVTQAISEKVESSNINKNVTSETINSDTAKKTVPIEKPGEIESLPQGEQSDSEHRTETQTKDQGSEQTEPLFEQIKVKSQTDDVSQDSKLAKRKRLLGLFRSSEESPEEKGQVDEKKSIFSSFTEKITSKVLTEDKFEELFFELEVVLLENNVAYEVIDKIKTDLKEHLVNIPIKRSELLSKIQSTLRDSIKDLFSIEEIDLLEISASKKPYVIMCVGVNGAGKTTTIAKIAHMFQKNGKRVVLAASDTFRAAAVEQLGEHAKRLNIKMIRHDYGSDAAAVAFDAIQYARAHELDIVLIDTAGRLHSNTNLMAELHKIVRVAKPDYTLFIGESITGNDCVEQARKFSETVQIDGIILSKADIDEKGGAAISVSYTTKKPILYLGTGQSYDDLQAFDKEKIIETIGL